MGMSQEELVITGVFRMGERTGEGQFAVAVLYAFTVFIGDR